MSSFEEDPLKAMLIYNEKWAGNVDRSLLAKNAKGQQPKVLWFGCADSRTPESVLCGTQPGDVFVHRNIANTYSESDDSANAVIAYAVNHLGVEDIVVVGHYSCGGVAAALSMASSPSSAGSASGDFDDTGGSTIAAWLAPLAERGRAQLKAKANLDEKESQRELVRTHAVAQADAIRNSRIVKRSIKEGKKIKVSAWVYDVATGQLTVLSP